MGEVSRCRGTAECSPAHNRRPTLANLPRSHAAAARSEARHASRLPSPLGPRRSSERAFEAKAGRLRAAGSAPSPSHGGARLRRRYRAGAAASGLSPALVNARSRAGTPRARSRSSRPRSRCLATAIARAPAAARALPGRGARAPPPTGARSAARPRALGRPRRGTEGARPAPSQRSAQMDALCSGPEQGTVDPSYALPLLVGWFVVLSSP